MSYTDNRGSGKIAEAVTANRVFGEHQRATFPSSEDWRIEYNTKRPHSSLGWLAPAAYAERGEAQQHAGLSSVVDSRRGSGQEGQRTVPENARPSVNIGAPVAAQDPKDDRLTYALSGPDAAAFTVVASSGQLRTSDSLDFETQSSYSFTIEVHDGRDGSGDPSTIVDDSQSGQPASRLASQSRNSPVSALRMN